VKNSWIIAGLAIFAVVLGAAILVTRDSCSAEGSAEGSCKQLAPTPAKNQAQVSKIDTINKDISSGALLVDVRTAEEFAAEHAARATNLPVEQISAGKYPTADKEATIYLYCRSGKRANTALATMQKLVTKRHKSDELGQLETARRQTI